MNARVLTALLQPGKIDEAAQLWRESLVPSLKQQSGFKGGLLLTDPNTGKGIAITLWETEADLKATEISGFFQEQIAKFAQVFAGSPTREAYEVSVQV